MQGTLKKERQMRYLKIPVFCIVSIVVFWSCLNQSVAKPVVPDNYKSWGVIVKEAVCILDNKPVILLGSFYTKSSSGISHKVLELSNQEVNSWLLLSATTSDLNIPISIQDYKLFEFKEGSWVFIREFSIKDLDALSKEVSDFMLTTYKLVCR